MNQSQAKQVVIGCTAGAAVLGSINQISDGKTPELKIAVGAGFMLVFLLLLADVADPQIAAALALMVLISSTVVVGPAPFNAVVKATKATSAGVAATSAVYRTTPQTNVKKTTSV